MKMMMCMCKFLMIQTCITGQPMPMVMLPSQEGVMTQENKLVKIHHKLKETTKVVIKTIKILILQSIKTMKMKMMV
jgi:hypothetical protein